MWTRAARRNRRMETGGTSAWDSLEVPGMWQQQGWQLNGAVWYRRTVEVPSEWQGRDLSPHFGALDDFDDTYVNGVRIGGMGTKSLERLRHEAALSRAGRDERKAAW